MTVKQRMALRRATGITLFLVPATLLLMNVGGISNTPETLVTPAAGMPLKLLPQELSNEDDEAFANDDTFTLDLNFAFLGESDADETELVGSDGKEVLSYGQEIISPDGRQIVSVHGKEIWPFEKDVLPPEEIGNFFPAQPTLGLPGLRPPFRLNRSDSRDGPSAAPASAAANSAQPPLVPIPEPGAWFPAVLCLALLSLRRVPIPHPRRS
ncbi:MAG: hypothetical protein M3463_07810 [Verrucomicrobiota bacterium]|nr:hypothetical protein [Verrucomicrobiota bacterium]